MLIDDVQEIQSIDTSGVAWVLVIEKEVASDQPFSVHGAVTDDRSVNLPNASIQQIPPELQSRKWDNPHRTFPLNPELTQAQTS